MELNEKLQELRRNRGLTQEELANALYVSRTAISKWESGRGYPSIDSLKELSRYFGVSLDDLLSGEELLAVAQEDNKRRLHHVQDLVFGLLDCSIVTFLFLPLFGQRSGDVIEGVSLLSLSPTPVYAKIIYLVMVLGLIACGVLTLALQNCTASFWRTNKSKASLGLSAMAALFFMISLQPYAAMLTFIFLVIKALMLIRWV